MNENRGTGITEEEVRAALVSWLENPFWREYYELAPSEACRQLVTLEFLYSEYETEEICLAMDAVEEELALADWQHLYRYCGINPRRKKIHDRIIALGGD